MLSTRMSIYTIKIEKKEKTRALHDYAAEERVAFSAANALRMFQKIPPSTHTDTFAVRYNVLRTTI